jgi:hypothetical protein
MLIDNIAEKLANIFSSSTQIPGYLNVSSAFRKSKLQKKKNCFSFLKVRLPK